MDAYFSRVSIPKAADIVASRIREDILRAQLKPGTRLPREREMASRLGVSRLTFREALRTLECLGLVETRRGGIFVCNGSIQSLRDSLMLVVELEGPSLQEVMEVRLMLEPYSASLAARNHTEEDLASIARALDQMSESTRDLSAYSAANSLFHMAIAEASHNTLLSILMRALGTLISRNTQLMGKLADVVETTLVEHSTVFRTIEGGDQTSAFAGMETHLKNSLATINQASPMDGRSLGDRE